MQYVTKRTFRTAWCFWWILWTWQQRCFRSYVKSENVTIITQVIDVEGTTKKKFKERPNGGGAENKMYPPVGCTLRCEYRISYGSNGTVILRQFSRPRTNVCNIIIIALILASIIMVIVITLSVCQPLLCLGCDFFSIVSTHIL